MLFIGRRPFERTQRAPVHHLFISSAVCCNPPTLLLQLQYAFNDCVPAFFSSLVHHQMPSDLFSCPSHLTATSSSSLLPCNNPRPLSPSHLTFSPPSCSPVSTFLITLADVSPLQMFPLPLSHSLPAIPSKLCALYLCCVATRTPDVDPAPEPAT